MDNIIIDPEFESKIPPLSEEEYKKLESNVLADGIIRDPLVVWENTLIDGHNRYRIHLSHPEIPFTTIKHRFSNRYEAIAWICSNQLGRRNLTPEDWTYLLGKQYEAEKAAYGASDGFRGNQHVELVGGKNYHLPTKPKTAEKIAKEHGISEKQVRLAETFAKGVDIADQELPGLKKRILSGQLKTRKKDIEALGKSRPSERKSLTAKLLTIPKRPAVDGTRTTAENKPPSAPVISLASDNPLTSQQKFMITEVTDAFNAFTKRWNCCISENKSVLPSDTIQAVMDKPIKELEAYIILLKENIHERNY